MPSVISYLPLGMPRALGMRPWRCRQGGRKPQGASKPVAAARGLWTALQASVMRMQYLGNSRTWGVAPGVVTRSGRAWARYSNCQRLGPNDAFNDIVLTSGYAGGLGNAPMEVWGRRGKAARRGEALQCCKASWRRAWAVDCTTSISKVHTVSG